MNSLCRANFRVRRLSVPASLVKQLRDQTSAPLMECKRALQATQTTDASDFSAARKWLASKGMEAAEKKKGRPTAEGRLGVAFKQGSLAVVEMSSETDFVSRNETFNDLCSRAAERALSSDDFEDLATEAAAEMRENVTCKSRLRWSVDSPLEVIGLYVHDSFAAAHTGRAVGALRMSVAETTKNAQQLANDLAKQLVASTPEFLETKHVSDARKSEILAATEADESLFLKPEKVQKQIKLGRLRKAFKDIVLREQDFLFDADRTVEELIKSHGGTVELLESTILKVGE